MHIRAGAHSNAPVDARRFVKPERSHLVRGAPPPAKPPFFVLGRPRSRTAWLANWLSYGDHSLCLHDEACSWQAFETTTRDRLRLAGSQLVGSANTALILWHTLLVSTFPDARFVFLLSEPDAFDRWAKKNGLDDEMRRVTNQAYCDAERALGHLERTVCVRVGDLGRRDALELVWRHVGILAPFPEERRLMLEDLDIQQLPRKILAAWTEE
jgi:hypothetical protein